MGVGVACAPSQQRRLREHWFCAVKTNCCKPSVVEISADQSVLQQPKDLARVASRMVKKMLVSTCSTKSAAVHGFGMTTAERAMIQDLGIVRTRIFADLYLCTIRQEG